MTTAIDQRGAACPIIVPAQGGMACVVSITGITVTSASDWQVVIRRGATDTATVVAATVTADVIANSVTFALTSTQIATVIASGQSKWSGFWYLRNVSTDRVILSDTFTIDRSRPATSSVGAVAVTVTTSTVSVEILTAVDPATLSAVASASAVRERRQGNLQPMRAWHAALGKRTIQPCDVVMQGDSIMEGWTSGNTAPVTNQDGMFGECQRQMAQIFNTHGYHGLWIPGGSGWFPNTRWSTEPNSDREANYGISLRGRLMQPGDSPATVTQVCDRIKFHYRKRNFLTGTMIVKIDGSTVLTVDTFDGSLAAFASQVYEFDSGSLTRGSHTLSVEQSSGGLPYSVLFDGAYFCDGDNAVGVRLWNASHFGYATLQYTQNTNWTDALRRNYIKPGLVVLALGSNESDPTTWYTQTSTLIDAIWAAADAGTSYPRPSIAIFTQPAAGTRTEAVNEQYRTYAYALALSKVDSTGVAGVDVWEWNEFQGGVSTTTGDPLAITADNVHPRGFEHRVLGEFLVAKMLENQSGMAGIIELQRQIDAGGGGGTADKLGLTPTAVKTSNYTATAGDLVPCDTNTTGAFTVTLPNAPADGSVVAVKHVIQGSTNAVTIACAGSDVVNKAGGVTSFTLSMLAQGVILQYKATGAIWYIVTDSHALSQLDARYAALYQPVDSDLTAIAALSTTAYGRALLALADAAAGRTALGLGSLSTLSTITTTEITDGTIANADLANMATKTYKGRHTAGTGAPDDVSATNVLADLSGAAAASFSMNSQKITSLLDGTATTDAAALRQAMFAAVAVPLISTYYVRSPAQLSTTTGTPTLNLMSCVPIVFTNAGTIVSIAAANNANTASAVCRLGLYADNGSGQPGALIDDYGTVDFSTGPSTKTITISRAVTAMTLYWLAAVEQGAATSAKVASNGSGVGLVPGYTTPLNSTIPTQCWTRASVSGSLPNPAVVTATGTSSIVVEVKI